MDLQRRGTIVRRQLHGGAIAGTVVGVLVVACLIALCLYPVLVRRIRRRRHQDAPVDDIETAQPTGADAMIETDVENHRRLSSNDSFKPGEQTHRSTFSERQSKELRRPSRGLSYATNNDQVPIPPTSAPAEVFYPNNEPQCSYDNGDGKADQDYSQFQGEFFPQSASYTEPGMLQGTSADYYSPTIPSEAFGMMPNEGENEEVISRPSRSWSRNSSLRHNVRHLFQRRSGRERTLSSFSSHRESDDTRQSREQDAKILRMIVPGEDPTESPANTSPVADIFPVASEANASYNYSGAGFPSNTGTQDSNTINPIWVMQPSTDSERNHYTTYQLQNPEVCSSPPLPELPTATNPETSIQAQDLDSNGSLPYAISPPLIENQVIFNSTGSNQGQDVIMSDVSSPNHLKPATYQYDGRRLSIASERSTPLPGPASTNPSTQNTPMTQLDSPSPPQSMGSSDFRHSQSPPLNGSVPSPKNGMYSCNEPGCSQAFDQPHKLK